MFMPALAKLSIASIDEPRLQVRAQYNPKELQIDKQVPWQPHNLRDNRPAGADTRSEQNPSEQPDHELNSAPTRSMTIELLFDGYETGISVEPIVQRLELLSSVRDPESDDSRLRRPHHCVVVWGGARPFQCVIESLTTKYSMWDGVGQPLRATCTLRLKEANRMDSPTAKEREGRTRKRPAGQGR
jgi:Contractile injection system tube protein